MKSKVLLLLFSCFFLTPAQAEESTHIFAAASLTAPLEEIAKRFENNTDQHAALTFASSSALARQITQGAPANIFISANERWMEFALNKTVIMPASRAPLVSNRLVIAGKANAQINTFPFSSTTDLSSFIPKQARIAIGDPNHVPIGIYAKEALESVGLWREWEPYFAPTNSARSALALTERGETPLGIHYQSDVLNKPTLKVISIIPEETHSPIIYEVAKIHGKDNAITSSFYEFLFSNEASNVFKRYGFKTLQDN